MEPQNAKMLSTLFEELSNSYSRISQVLKAFGDGEQVDINNIFPAVHEAAQTAAGVVSKGKKQKKLPRYENTWSKEELTKLEEGLKRFGFDVTKVQTHIGSRKAAEVKKYMTQFVKAGMIPGVKLPEDHDEDEDDSSSEEEPKPKKPQVKKAAAAPKAAAKKQAKKSSSSSSSSEEESDDDDEKQPGKRAASDSDSDDEAPKSKRAKKNKKDESDEESSSDS